VSRIREEIKGLTNSMQSGLYLQIILLFAVQFHSYAKKWIPDLGNGSYKNPVIFMDYSDPDVVKVGDDFYMTASSFHCVPALPILHSNDLVNWKIVNHAIQRFEDPAFDRPQHGNGAWAPAIRTHNGAFVIYYGDPDRGIYMVKTENPLGEWEKPVLVKKAFGNIDPCPLWDDDGKVYMVHAFAHSRAGVKSILQINELTQDGKAIVDKGIVVFDGHKNHPTIEGPKFLKRNGYYYIFAPAGGVTSGWQTVLRAHHIYGPYEDRVVMVQGQTEVNGPHQGAYIELDNGEGWFVHFQDLDAYGRIVHLQPVKWVDDWPVIGQDIGHGMGEPVAMHLKPDTHRSFPVIPQTSDDFDSDVLGLQWQWQANPSQTWYSFRENQGKLRLYAQPFNSSSNYWSAPYLLLQKLPAPDFTATTSVQLGAGNCKAGLMIMGMSYAYIALERKLNSELQLVQVICIDAEHGGTETVHAVQAVREEPILLRISVAENASCSFQFSLDGKKYKNTGTSFQASPGKWVGAKVGMFASCSDTSENTGFADFEFFSID
jgi:beta-xylosidase